MPFSRPCRRTDPWAAAFRSTVLLLLHTGTHNKEGSRYWPVVVHLHFEYILYLQWMKYHLCRLFYKCQRGEHCAGVCIHAFWGARGLRCQSWPERRCHRSEHPCCRCLAGRYPPTQKAPPHPPAADSAQVRQKERTIHERQLGHKVLSFMMDFLLNITNNFNLFYWRIKLYPGRSKPFQLQNGAKQLSHANFESMEPVL